MILVSDHDDTPSPLPSDAEARARHAPVIAQAGQFAAPLAGAAIATGLSAVVLAAISPLRQSPSACAAVVMLLLATAAVGAVAVVSGLRARVLSDELEELEAARQRQQREAEGRSLFTGRLSEDSSEQGPTSELCLTRWGRTHIPLGLAAGAVAVAGLSGYAVVVARPEGAPERGLLAVGIGCLLVAFAAMFGSRWTGAQSDELLPEARAVSALLRAVQWSTALAAPALMSHALGFPVVDRWVGLVLLVLCVVLSVELVARAGAALLRAPASAELVRAPVGMTIADSLFAGANPLTSTLELLESRFGVSVRSSYVIGYTGRSVPWVVLGMLTAFWLATSLVSIPLDEAGVVTRFGRLTTNCRLDPGLHLKAPWPIDRVEKVETSRVRRLLLGRGSDDEVPYILWSRVHAKDEYKLVLGEGRELVSLDVQVYYRVKDPVAFVTRWQNPISALGSLAYRLMIRQVLPAGLEHVLAEGRGEIRTCLRSDLQAATDAQGLGIEVVDVLVRSTHPPVEVAQAYQSVVSAQVEKVTLGVRARAERAEALPAAEAARHSDIVGARAKAATRLAGSRGEAIRFNAVDAAYSADPGLYRRRCWLETLESSVADKSLYVVAGSGGGAQEYWVDFRGGPSEPKK